MLIKTSFLILSHPKASHPACQSRAAYTKQHISTLVCDFFFFFPFAKSSTYRSKGEKWKTCPTSSKALRATESRQRKQRVCDVLVQLEGRHKAANVFIAPRLEQEQQGQMDACS